MGGSARMPALPAGARTATAKPSPWTRARGARGQEGARGEPIGEVGRSGSTNEVPHVHLELCTFPCESHGDGDFDGTEDPLAIAAGCYDTAQAYPSDRLVITFPVHCQHWERWR